MPFFNENFLTHFFREIKIQHKNTTNNNTGKKEKRERRKEVIKQNRWENN